MATQAFVNDNVVPSGNSQDGSSIETPVNVGPGQSPFYQAPNITDETTNQKDIQSPTNAQTLSNYQVSNSVNPSPNTLVPLDNTGKLPASVLPNTGTWALVSKQTVANSSGITLSSSLTPGARYMVVGQYVQNTSTGTALLRFNGDSGSNYVSLTYTSTASSGVGGSAVTLTGFITAHLTISVVAGGSNSFCGYFVADPANANNAWVHGTFGAVYQSTTNFGTGFWGGIYKGSSNITSVSIVPGAATFSGTFSLYQEGVSVVVGQTGPQGATGATGSAGAPGVSAAIPLTRTTLTTGSGTYTTPVNCKQLRIRQVGGGGGGGAAFSGGTSGSTGGDTSFNSIVAKGGGGGGGYGLHFVGLGGTGGTGTATLRIRGGGGGTEMNTFGSGKGGDSAFGGGGAGLFVTGTGDSGAANSGGGGGGGPYNGGSGGCGSGGGAGEYVELVINSPSASYSYTVGSGGAGGTGGNAAGGAGGSGIIIIDEVY